MREIKDVSLALLEKIDEICRKNHITYYMAYGTLLGAVRHKGFIPWDDDADIWVPYNQFDDLMNILSSLKDYQVLNFRAGTYWSTFAKFCDKRTIVIDRNERGKPKCRGVAVDIFLLYGCQPGDSRKYRVLAKLRNLMWLYENGYWMKSLNRATAIVLKIFGKGERYWCKRLNNLQEKRADTAKVGNPVSRYGEQDIHPKECFTTMELDFEGRLFFAPAGYDRILLDIYGDYMNLPPEEDRVKTHSAQPFWVEEETN